MSDADAAIREAVSEIHMPPGIHGMFAGTAQVFSQSLQDQPVLILAALLYLLSWITNQQVQKRTITQNVRPI